MDSQASRAARFSGLAALSTALCAAFMLFPQLVFAASISQADLDANKALDQKYLTAMSAKDIDAVMSCYISGPDLVFIAPDGNLVTGSDNLRQNYIGLFSSLKSFKVDLADATYTPVGDTVLGTFTAKVTTVSTADVMTVGPVVVTVIHVKGDDGDWRYAVDHVQNVTAAQPTDSLYKRLGGYDAIAAVTDDFLTRLTTDDSLKRFFGGVSTNSKVRIRQLLVDQLVYATGGPAFYIGRDMKTSHKGLGITEADWTQMAKLFGQTLDKFQVGDKERTDLFAALGTLKPNIVEKP